MNSEISLASRSQFKQSLLYGGPPPYAYDDPNGMVIVPEEMQICRGPRAKRVSLVSKSLSFLARLSTPLDSRPVVVGESESVPTAGRLSDALPVRQLLPVDKQRSKGVRSSRGLEVVLTIVLRGAAFLDRADVASDVLGLDQFAQQKPVDHRRRSLSRPKAGRILDQNRNSDQGFLAARRTHRKCDAAAG